MFEFETVQELKTNDEKVNYVLEMDLENKLRLAICMCDNYSHTNLEYDKKEVYKYFDKLHYIYLIL